MNTLEERIKQIKDASERFPNISDEELERIGCMRMQYLKPRPDGGGMEITEGFDAIPFELYKKSK